MKKMNILLLSALLLFPFLASAQTFPMLGNVYSVNCSNKAITSYFWTKENNGEIVRYTAKLKDNVNSFTKNVVKNFSIQEEKISIESIDTANQDVMRELLELKPNSKAFRTLNLSIGGKDYLKEGKVVSDQSRESIFIGMCEPDSEAVTFIKSQFKELPTASSDQAAKKAPAEKCYLKITGGDQTIDSCDPETIKNSLAGNNRASLWKFKSDSEIDQMAIFSNAEAKSFAEITRGGVYKQFLPSSINYKASGNQIVREAPAGSGCFITYTVQEKSGYRKEFYKGASPSCPAYIINANKMVLEDLKSGKDKGYRIIGK